MPLDHVVLNDLPAFKDLNPSTENLARHIYRALKCPLRPFAFKASAGLGIRYSECHLL